VSDRRKAIADRRKVIRRKTYGRRSDDVLVQYSTTVVDPSGGVVPVLLFTDIVSGSATNGEGGAGAYLTLYGLNFGTPAAMGTPAGAQVTIGGQAVAKYRYLVHSKTWGIRAGFPNIWALCVQIGSAGVKGLTAGSTYAVGLTVAGIASNTTDVLGNAFNFTVQPGHFYFVDTANGSEATGAVDDIAHPFRYVQNYSGNTPVNPSVWNTFSPGDTIVIRGNSGTAISDNVGFDSRLCRIDRTYGGSAPNGTIGHGYYHFTSYPGAINGNAPEDVYILCAASGRGGFMGASSAWGRGGASYVGGGRYWTCSNMRSDASGATGTTDASNFNLQNAADNTRFVNLDVQFNTSSTNLLNGGIVGDGDAVKVLGCYIHSILGSPASLENHGIYGDGNGNNILATNWEVGFVICKDCTSGQGIQFHNGFSGTFTGNNVHHFWVENTGKDGILMDAPGANNKWWNGVINKSQRESIRIDGPGSNPTCYYENITCVDGAVSNAGPYNSIIVNEGTAFGANQVTVKNCVLAFTSGRTNTGAGWVSAGGVTVDDCLYFDYNGTLSSGYAGDAHATYADPKFTNTSPSPNTDVTISATSPALNKAVSATINPVNDLAMNVQPRLGQASRSLGAIA